MREPTRKLLALACAAALCLPGTAHAATAPSWKRLQGASRYDTMSAIVEEGFQGSDRVVVASGEAFPDALAASALAGALDCPVLLTEHARLSSQTAAQLGRLGAREAYVVGGEAAVSARAQSQIEELGVSVRRVAGDSRFATSTAVLDAVRAEGSNQDVVIVAAGGTFADSLSISPWAYATATPVVLAQPDGTLDDHTADAVRSAGFSWAILVGGSSVVSDEVATQLGIPTMRLGGADRYQTSERIADWGLSNGLTFARPAVASGRNFPDALAGSALCGRSRSVLLLANDADDPTALMLQEHKDECDVRYLLGGAQAVFIAGNSDLVDVVIPSPNNSGPRLYPITKITPHYMSEQWSAEQCGLSFAKPEREASSNYGIGLDGEIGLYVNESDRSWASSSSDNDNRAVTIECASLPDDSLTDATWNALVDLCVDICQRNGIARLEFTGDESGNLTMHKYFNPKTVCPGPWFSARFDQLAAEVNARL